MPQKIAKLKITLQMNEMIWDELPDEAIRKSVQSFCRRLSACVKAQGRHFEHSID